jgi:hypothetical protein
MARRILALAGVLTLAIAGVAAATVTFDSNTGRGFVGKGDVQLAFGWNNAVLQANARLVSFSYDAVDTYEATCTWVTGEGTRGERTHDIDIPRRTSISSTIAYDARTHRQVDGFILNGFVGDPTVGGTVPVVGEACVAEDGDGIAQNGTWTTVTLLGSTGGLYVSYGGNSVLLQ